MLHRLLVPATTAAFVLTLAACGSPAPTPAPPPEGTSSPPTTGTLLNDPGDFGPDYYQSLGVTSEPCAGAINSVVRDIAVVVKNTEDWGEDILPQTVDAQFQGLLGSSANLENFCYDVDPGTAYSAAVVGLARAQSAEFAGQAQSTMGAFIDGFCVLVPGESVELNAEANAICASFAGKAADYAPELPR